MTEGKVRKGHSVALSGVIGFVLAALLIGMILGVALSFYVIGPIFFGLGNHDNNQNTNYQNGNNNQGPTGNPYNNNQNNNQNGYYPSPTGNSNGNQNGGGGGGGVTNNNPPITNSTGQYSGSGKQFTISVSNGNGGTASGTITADVTCVISQDGNNIQLDVTITPTNIPQSLSQAITSNSPVTFNFAGTTSGSQINAQASGSTGSDPNSPDFNFILSGTLGSNSLTVSVTSSPNMGLSVSTPQPVTLQLS